MSMVEVGDVDVIGDQCRFADLDVQVAIDRVPAAEHRLIADPEGAFVAPYRRASTDVHRPAEDEPAEVAARIDLYAGVQIDHPQGDHMRIRQSKPEKAPVTDQMPRRVRAIPHQPSQGRRRDHAGAANWLPYQQPRVATEAPSSRSCATSRSRGVAKTSTAPASTSSPGCP